MTRNQNYLLKNNRALEDNTPARMSRNTETMQTWLPLIIEPEKNNTHICPTPMTFLLMSSTSPILPTILPNAHLPPTSLFLPQDV
jgi:hypothetical protein